MTVAIPAITLPCAGTGRDTTGHPPACDGNPAADLSPLAAAARQAGLGEREITRTLQSARNGGRTRTPAPGHQAEAGEV